LRGDDTRRGREFWCDSCRTLDFNAGNSVLSCFERKSEADFAPECVVREIHPSLFDNIRKVCSNYDASTADCLLACWEIFLSRITGQPSIMIGCAAGERTHPDLQGAIGPVMKYLPIQLSIDLELPFCALLAQA